MWAALLVAAFVLGTGCRGEDRPLGEPIKFAADFYSAVHEESPTGNVIVSPFSVQAALGLLLMGADGSTAEEIANGLYLHSNDRSTIATHFEEMLGRYTPSDVLKIANKVYTKSGLTIHPDFDAIARNQFNSEVESIEFEEPAKAAETINSWVEDRTDNKIKNLFSPDQLGSDTLMVLVNAIHFRAAWQDPFKEEHTRKAAFWISETESVQVDMMYSTNQMKFGVVDDLDARVGFMEYKNQDLSMMIILPKSRTGLDELEQKLKTYDFSNVTAHVHRRWIQVSLPKFTIESTVDLRTVLTKMGMGTMFTNAASFPGMMESRTPSKIDNALQKAFINVDEKGTEAAAATALKRIPMSGKPSLRVDHPFFFAIVGPKDVLFVGSVRRP